MTLHHNVNISSTGQNASAQLYAIKEVLKAAGWVVTRSGTGSGGTYNASGDAITSASVMANTNTWFVIRPPTGTRQLCFQLGTFPSANQAIRAKYSASAGFTGGTPSATQVPSATDEKILWGGGTDAAPTFFNWARTTSAENQRYHVVADDVAPYRWWMVSYPAGGGIAWQCFLYDPLVPGTYPTEDTDPIILYMDGGSGVGSPFSSTSGFQGHSTTTTPLQYCPQCYLAKGLAGEVWTNVSAGLLSFNNSQAVPPSTYTLGANPHTSKDEALPVLYARSSQGAGTFGWKGWSSTVKWAGTTRATGSTLTIDTTKDHIVINKVALPWPGLEPLV